MAAWTNAICRELYDGGCSSSQWRGGGQRQDVASNSGDSSHWYHTIAQFDDASVGQRHNDNNGEDPVMSPPYFSLK